ncbi:MAG: RICIN domain-containing protein [Streptosporangiaceae bacterium]
MRNKLAGALAAGVAGSALFATAAHADTTCGFSDVQLAGQNSGYFMNANPWGIKAATQGRLCMTNNTNTQQNPNPNFSITDAYVNQDVKIDSKPAVAAYPHLATKNTWDGQGSLGLPVPLSKLGTSPTSADIGALPAGPTLNASYDLWLNQNCQASDLESGANSIEIMVWLNHSDGAQPGGATIDAAAAIDGRSYAVNYEARTNMKTLWYVMNTKVNAVSNLDLAPILRDSATRAPGGVKVIGEGTNFCRAEFGFEAYDNLYVTPGGTAGPTVYSFAFGNAAAQRSGTISTQNTGSRCLDGPSGTNADGSPKQVQLYDCNGSDTQWVNAVNDGTIHIRNKCLDAAGNGTTNGTKVQLYDCNHTDAQKWVFNATGTIVNTHSGLCLDAAGSGTANGTLLQLYTCNTTIAQKWWYPAS